MQRVALKESSNISYSWYSAATMVLVVTFKSGDEYEYVKVPNDLICAWEKASSVGSFFAKNIRNAYEYRRVVDLEEVI